ncbi:MAG: TIGR03750 family conjugal transfer protein [Salinicola sp.]|uniref:TIGR03750 family conjugal transfer protein n=1 Tax=uncultured Salinicola sp. TaxID=1193542 RepID=UPI000C98AF1B|nr:TIGR03750 family conjugal transfer protein [uncultured Salinicola sp.]MAM55820.1 TIGR03750 family conjugal transfer protein [Salinicola sp.]|tara:strand:+ start:108 stop:485 length:378 start_codon:yes stop_codon:yes gene_type:complete
MASIDFLPKRINDPPVVFRGMTMREVMLMAGTGFLSFLVVGIPVAIVFGMPALAPSIAVLGMACALGAGGTIMRRLRRGRPASLLYRQISWKLASRGISMGGERLITRSSVYRIGRERRPQGGLR